MDNWQDRSVLLTLLSASGIQGYPQRVIYLVDLKPFGTILKFPPVGVSVSKNIGWKHTFCLPSFYCIFCALDDSFVLFRFNFVPLMLFAPLCHGQCSPRVPLLVSSFANQPPIIHPHSPLPQAPNFHINLSQIWKIVTFRQLEQSDRFSGLPDLPPPLLDAENAKYSRFRLKQGCQPSCGKFDKFPHNPTISVPNSGCKHWGCLSHQLVASVASSLQIYPPVIDWYSRNWNSGCKGCSGVFKGGKICPAPAQSADRMIWPIFLAI